LVASNCPCISFVKHAGKLIIINIIIIYRSGTGDRRLFARACAILLD
jgi:hypothetical protein